MPLYKSIAVDDQTHVLIWEITETESELNSPISLKENSIKRVASMKSEQHRKAYLSVRHLLAIAQYSDEDLTYNENGKPSLVDGVFISITHSHQYSAIILSAKPVGIDIEKQREKIRAIAHKFISPKEQEYLKQQYLEHENEKIKALTIIWGTKESIYKLYGKKGVSFGKHMDVAPFTIEAPQTKASINYKEEIIFFDVYILDFDCFTCVFVY